jgi:hypothetical protein
MSVVAASFEDSTRLLLRTKHITAFKDICCLLNGKEMGDNWQHQDICCELKAILFIKVVCWLHMAEEVAAAGWGKTSASK